ncbi:MAG: ORF6N domain-containing protein [Nitrospirota bacterium]
MPSRKTALVHESLEPLIFVVRNQRVILDADLARLYGVTTKSFNQAVKRNADRFPEDFAFQLTIQEVAQLRSQAVTSNAELIDTKREDQNRSQIAISSNRSQFVTGSQKHRDPRLRPWAFTEHGAVMAANILRSERAIHMSVFVVRVFVRLREHVAANQAILKRLAEIDQTLLQHDSALLDLYEKLLPLLQPLPDHPKRRIGFQSKGKP